MKTKITREALNMLLFHMQTRLAAAHAMLHSARIDLEDVDALYEFSIDALLLHLLERVSRDAEEMTDIMQDTITEALRSQYEH